jgi:hypothetical protein
MDYQQNENSNDKRRISKPRIQYSPVAEEKRKYTSKKSKFLFKLKKFFFSLKF